MCGLISITLRRKGLYSQSQVVSALSILWEDLAVRGQDSYGIARLSELTYAAHALLSISEPERPRPQPRFSGKTNSSIVYNGEIFSVRGDKWCGSETHSCDTDFLLAYIERWGVYGLSKLDGMFAFVFSDAANNQVSTARDRFGEKPLFYYKDKDVYVVGSSPFAIVRLLRVLCGITEPLSTSNLMEHLIYGACEGLRTIFQNIYSHPSGSVGLLDIENWELSFTRYWRPPLPLEIPESAHLLQNNTRLEFLKQCLTEQIRRIIPPNAHALMLSGGVDSSLVAHLHPEPRNLSAYTAQFTDACFSSEHERARQTAKNAGIPLYNIRIRPTDLESSLQVVFSRQSYPVDDTSCLMVDLLSKHIGNIHRVCLTGDGADEMFFGYDSYLYPYKNLLDYGSMRFQVVNIANIMVDSVDVSKRAIMQAEISRIIDLHLTNSLGMDRGAPAIELARQYDIEFYMKKIVLSKVDMFSMLNNVECRTPFLRLGLAEYALSIPYDLQVATKTCSGLKPYLRELLHAIDPTYPADKPKQGFGAQPEVCSLLTNAIVHEIMKQCRECTHFGNILRSYIGISDVGGLLRHATSNIYFGYRLASLASYVNRLGGL